MRRTVVIPSCTLTMKTAITVPDETFRRVDERAAALGMSRSEFYSRAAEGYIGVACDFVEYPTLRLCGVWRSATIVRKTLRDGRHRLCLCLCLCGQRMLKGRGDSSRAIELFIFRLRVRSTATTVQRQYHSKLTRRVRAQRPAAGRLQSL